MKKIIVKNKSIKIILIIGLIGILALFTLYFLEIYRTKNYIKTEAVIIENIIRQDYGTTNNSKSTKYKYIKVKYDEYTIEYRVWSFLFKKEGTSTVIYYNKDDPYKIRDKFKMSTLLMGFVFLSVFETGLYLSQKKQYY